MTTHEYVARLNVIDDDKHLGITNRLILMNNLKREYIASLEAENAALIADNAKLEKAAVVWHKYPEEKPKPNTRHLVVVNGYVLISRYDAEQDIDKINVTHWAYLPAPPKEGE